jgi:hypothetical protein
MPALDNPVSDWQHAYQALGVPNDATALTIKSAYRALIKRWHPDHYAPGTRNHTEATQMMVLINQAYSAIANAPLRYRSSSPTQAGAAEPYRPQADGSPQYNRVPYQSAPRKPGTYVPDVSYLAQHWVNHPRADRIEFCIRFVCGALLGLIWSLGIIFTEFRTPVSQTFEMMGVLGSIGLMIGSGLAAARYGDKFWYSAMGKWDPF